MRIPVLALAFLGLVQAQPKEADEPPLQLALRIAGGAPVPVRIDQPFTAVVDGKRVEMVLIAQPFRVFRAGGVHFHYPARFTFEYEQDIGVTTWSLEGPATLMMLMRFAKEDPKALLQRMEDQFAQSFGKGAKRGDAKLGTLVGRSLDVRVLDEPLRQEMFAFDAGGGTFLLIVQDSLTLDGDPAPETIRAKELFAETLEINPK